MHDTLGFEDLNDDSFYELVIFVSSLAAIGIVVAGFLRITGIL